MPNLNTARILDPRYRDLKPGNKLVEVVGGVEFSIFANIHPGAPANARSRFCITCMLCHRLVHKDTIHPRYFMVAHLSEKHPILPGTL